MIKKTKTKKVTTDDLAIMVAEGFNRVEKKIDNVDKGLSRVKDDIKDIRKDILCLGDRFVSYHTFDALASRVKVIEEKK